MIIIAHPGGRDAERRYIYSVIFGEFLGLEYILREQPGDAAVISSDDVSQPGAIIIPDTLFSTRDAGWLAPSSLPVLPLRSCALNAHFRHLVHQDTLPVLYGARGGNGSLYHREGTAITATIDILGSVFFMLTRYEEAVLTRRDRHRRMLFDDTVMVREGLTHRALVNEYVEILWDLMRWLWPEMRRKERTYRLIPTHDIDVPSWSANVGRARLFRSLAADLAIRRDGGLAVKRYRSVAGRSNGDHRLDPNNTFGFIMDCSERSNVRSTFFLKAGRTSPEYDTDMLVGHEWMRTLIRSVYMRGHEIGLHPSYGTLDDPGLIRKEFGELVRVCNEEGIEQRMWGGRQHYLRWENPDTWQHYEDAGLMYDSSLGFVRTIGFRTGCCYEYPCFNLKTRQRLRVRERPLIIMDSNIFQYWLQPTPKSMEKIFHAAETCRLFRGDFIILWHNSSLISVRQQHAYSTIVKHCS